VQAIEQSGMKSLQKLDGGTGYSMERVTVSPEAMDALATQMGEVTLFGRTGGAATLAVGMAKIFHSAMPWLGDKGVAIWYHFALMFEALFILTTLDAGTRVGRYLLQDSLKRIAPRLGDTRSTWAGIVASALIVIGWGFFLIMGVRDPDGGVKALWPIFGIANQLLASIALCLATTILIKLQLQRGKSPALAFVTLLPLAWLLTVTMTAGVTKVWDKNPRIGFLAAADAAQAKIDAVKRSSIDVSDPNHESAIRDMRKAITTQTTVHFNNFVDAWVTGIFLALVTSIVLLSIAEWLRLFAGRKAPKLSETEPVWLPASALETARPANVFGMAALGFTLIKELSGQAAIDREQRLAETCNCTEAQTFKGRQNVFLTATDRRYRGVNKCC
jgi:carbon starvation protein